MFKSIALAASAIAMTAVPVAASAAPAAASNAASKLSLSSARASSTSGKSNKFGGPNAGPIAAGLIAVGIAVGAYFVIDDQEDDTPDSN
jgi:hypothetical protein